MSTSLALGLLIIRLVAGLTLAAHGAQKVFGWFGGPGPAKLTQGFQAQGLKPGWFWAVLVMLGELGGGLSLAFGLLTPLGAAGIVGAMLMASLKSHWHNGFWNNKRGYEFPLTLLAIGVGIGLTGPGTYSLDSVFALRLPGVALFGVLVLVAVIVDVVGLLMSRPVAQPAAAASSS